MKKFLIAGAALVFTAACLLPLLAGCSRLDGVTVPPETVTGAATQTFAPTAAPTAPASTAATAPTVASTTGPATVPSQPPLTAPQAAYAFVYDPYADWLLYEQGDPRDLVYPASLTKIFTAYVGLLILDPETEVTVGPEVKLIHPESSLAGLQPGDRLTVQMLVQGMLLPSGNDAAYALAAAAGYALSENAAITPQAAIELFMEAVNSVAQAHGLSGTHFSTPDGIHREDHYTTAYDLLQMAALAMENPVIAQIAAQPTATVTFLSGQEHTWVNTNALLQPDSPYYVAGCMGLKTGFEGPAGFCLLTVFPCEDRYRFALVLKAPTLEARFADSVWLYEQFLKD